MHIPLCSPVVSLCLLHAHLITEGFRSSVFRFLWVLAGTLSLVLLRCWMFSLYRTPASECPRRTPEYMHGHPLSVGDFTALGWVCSPFTYWPSCPSWRCRVVVLSDNTMHCLVIPWCGVKSPVQLLLLQVQLCVYGLYLIDRKARNTNFYTSKKADSQHVSLFTAWTFKNGFTSESDKSSA